MICSCGKKNDDDETAGVVVERTFSTQPPSEAPAPTPAPTPEPTPEPSEPSPAGELPEGSEFELLAYANSDGVNVRETNSTSGNILGTLPFGSLVYVCKKDYGNGWSSIIYQGKNAFVAAQYLTELSKEKTVTIECRAEVNTDEVNLRAGGATSAELIGKLSAGTKVDVIKKDAGHGWSMILYEDKVAFVSSTYLTFETQTADA